MAKATLNNRDVTSVIVRPRITEKASMQVEKNVYTFEVSKAANKSSIMQAIRELYKVTPIDVRVVAIPTKSVFSRGKFGTKKGGKKAYVQLAKGDKIEFV